MTEEEENRFYADEFESFMSSKYSKSGGCEKIFIRLHPSLKKEHAIKEILSISEIPKNIKYEFIENKEESFIKSIQLSKYCFFGYLHILILLLK